MSMQIAAMPMVNSISAAATQELHLPRPMRQTQEKEKPVDFKEFEATLPGNGRAAADLQQISLAFNRKLKFEVNQESREILIKVIDGETDKVIKVLPPAELQRLHSRIRETLGFLFDETA